MKYLMTLFLAIAVAYSCGDTEKSKTPLASDVHKVVAQEVLHVKEYTYVRVNEDGNEYWVAAPTTPVAVGNTYYYGKTMEMQNFESKELNKKFETIYFIEKLSTTEADTKLPLVANPHLESDVNSINEEATKPTIEKKNVAIESAEGTITIAELFKNREKYNNTVVKLKAEVTKVNRAIMNTNWLHLQDGTEFNGEFDLTVTTAAEVQIGDVVIVEGTVTLNKDFGAGYVYAIIVENANLIN